LRGQKNFDFRMVDVTRVDFAARRLETSAGHIAYDFLVLAPGGEDELLRADSDAAPCWGSGHPDAIAIRNHVLTCFEQAMLEPDASGGGRCSRSSSSGAADRRGGWRGRSRADPAGPGQRLSSLNIKDVRILLLEATDQLLAALPTAARGAGKTLWRKYIEVRFAPASPIMTAADPAQEREAIPLGHRDLGRRRARLATQRHAGAECGAAGPHAVEPTLQVQGHPEVFIIGDAAYREENGEPLPMVAPVAIQMGRAVARNIIVS